MSSDGQSQKYSTTMATEAAENTGATEDRAAKTHHRKSNKQGDPIRQRSIFEVPADFFDSCLLHSPSVPLPDSDYTKEDDAVESSKPVKEAIDGNSHSKPMQRWSCNTCKTEFESLQDQRFHFKSDLHRFNIKLYIAGKHIIKEEDFDEANSESLCKDYDVSSISGSEDEDERDTRLLDGSLRQYGGALKSKLFLQLQTIEKASVWKCLLLDEFENISFENAKFPSVEGCGNITYLGQSEVIEKLKCIIREPRDKTRLRIVLLAKGGHFAGCVFDGNSIIAHKTFHRYVVRAKAGKKQSSKDASGRGIHSAGASLRRYNELALKKDIQELLTLWKPYFAAASCIFIHAPSNNHQLFFDGDKPYFISQHHAIRNIPLAVRRPTFKEARRVYSLLTLISYEKSEDVDPEEDALSVSNVDDNHNPESCEMESKENVDVREITEACSIADKKDGLAVSVKPAQETDFVGIETPLHEAAKLGNAQRVLELLEQGLDPCIEDEKGQTPYMLAREKEVRNTFRRFMASNLEKWDWHAAKVPSPLTKEMEESQAAKQAEKDAKRKAKAKELKKLRKAKEKAAQTEAAKSQKGSVMPGSSGSGQDSNGELNPQSSGAARISKEEEQRRIREAEREKRAAAAEKRIAALKALETVSATAASNLSGSDVLCSCCNVSLAGKVPFHRYHYKYCSTSCMHVHREMLEDG